MTDAARSDVATDFREPFVGHLPGYLAQSELTGPDRPSEEIYNDLLMERWDALLDDDASRDERLVHTFLERHPSLLPGSHTLDVDSGHSPFPMAVISKPKLPGLSDREPDFMWLATHSTEIFPILIEIETPHKRWFYGDRAEIHSDFTHAQGQLAEWRAWFNRGNNRAAFLDYYELPSQLRDRKLSPRFVLIYGRSGDYNADRRRREKRAELAREDERLLSFDSLTPTKHSVLYSTVAKRHNGYKVLAVPPSLTIFNHGEFYLPAVGWEPALDACNDMASSRREFLKEEFRLLLENPDAYTVMRGRMRLRRPRWL
ncbi:Shedu anti-phage system protein SduA domain-containing protein [Micromonospora sp. NPDC048930]|uniref:Shedu anti-phage system protein SduA domain-containing protein n=1 Tax=Micromonospora sp. NPDC048930 TaxID=3364261 RepID=UPI003714F2BE